MTTLNEIESRAKQYAEAREALASIRHDRPVAEGRDIQQSPSRLVRGDDGARAGRIIGRDPHELEIERAVVVHDVQHVVAVDPIAQAVELGALPAHPHGGALAAAEFVDLRLGEFDGRRRAVGGKRRAHVQRHAGMMPHRRARREGQLNGLRSRLSALWPAATVANDV